MLYHPCCGRKRRRKSCSSRFALRVYLLPSTSRPPKSTVRAEPSDFADRIIRRLLSPLTSHCLLIASADQDASPAEAASVQNATSAGTPGALDLISSSLPSDPFRAAERSAPTARLCASRSTRYHPISGSIEPDKSTASQPGANSPAVPLSGCPVFPQYTKDKPGFQRRSFGEPVSPRAKEVPRWIHTPPVSLCDAICQHHRVRRYP